MSYLFREALNFQLGKRKDSVVKAMAKHEDRVIAKARKAKQIYPLDRKFEN
jgi:hypothetical protein